MAIFYTCDRCGSILKSTDRRATMPKATGLLAESLKRTIQRDRGNMHLCMDCTEKLHEAIRKYWEDKS